MLKGVSDHSVNHCFSLGNSKLEVELLTITPLEEQTMSTERYG